MFGVIPVMDIRGWESFKGRLQNEISVIRHWAHSFGSGIHSWVWPLNSPRSTQFSLLWLLKVQYMLTKEVKFWIPWFSGQKWPWVFHLQFLHGLSWRKCKCYKGCCGWTGAICCYTVPEERQFTNLAIFHS